MIYGYSGVDREQPTRNLLTLPRAAVGGQTYNATVIVTDSVGNIVTSQSAQIVVQPGLVAVISATPQQIIGSGPVTFGVQVSGGLAPYTYHWDFGDGTSFDTSVPNATHQYTYH